MQDLLEPLFDEVQASNMSKLTKDGKVLRREDGKILKSDQFFKPDLASIVHKYLASPIATEQSISMPWEIDNDVVQSLKAALAKGVIDANQLRMLLQSDKINFKEYLRIVGW